MNERVTAFYDAVAAEYVRLFPGGLADLPLERALVEDFADGLTGPVLDVGCGPGWLTAHLHGLGLDVCGVDLSTAMLRHANTTHPEVRYRQGDLAALDVADGALGGLVAWYSVIHSADRLPAVLAGFARAIRPGGRLLLAFQVGDEPSRVSRPGVWLDFNRLRPAAVAGLLRGAGFAVDGQLVRAPGEREQLPQGYLLAHRTSSRANGTTGTGTGARTGSR